MKIEAQDTKMKTELKAATNNEASIFFLHAFVFDKMVARIIQLYPSFLSS